MSTDYRALCAELLDALENAIGVIYGEDGTKHISTADAVITKADAALAQPEPVAPTDEDVTELFYRHMGEGSEVGFENAIAEALARWGTPAIQPVPVSERLPGPEDCDGEGRCWWFSPPACGPHTIRPCWTFDSKTLEGDTHWLPYWALPVPGVEGADE